MERVLAFSHSGSRPTRRIVALAAVVSAISIVFLVFAPAAASQADSSVARVRERLERAQADARNAQARYEQAVAEHEQSLVQMTELEQAITSARTQEAALRSGINRRAVALYKNADTTGFQALDTGEPMDAGRRTKFTEYADEYYEEQARQLDEQADRDQQAHDDLQKRRAELDGAIPRLEQEKAESAEKLVRANRGLEIAEQLAPLRAQGEPVMGPTVLNASEMAAWLRSTGSSPRLSDGVTLEHIAQMFVDEGAAEGVRGDFAFAQAYIETGGFSAGGSENNFSGLGACDSCGGQNQFPNALEGIRAQMQLLKAYAGGGPLVNPPSPYWWRGDAAGAYASFGDTGDAPTWRQMGAGNWATDPAYSSKVLGTYDKMIASAGGS